MATTREEPTQQYWRVSPHHNWRGDRGYCTSRGFTRPQIETHPLHQSNRSPDHHQRRVTSAQLESSPHHLRGAFPHNVITQKPPSSTREAPMPQIKRRGHTKIREQARKYRNWKECLCTLLPERKPLHNSRRTLHCNSRGASHTP